MPGMSPFTRSLLAAGCLAVLAAALPAGQAPAPGAFPPPVDPQAWQDQDDMTWADYRPIPGTSWGDRSRRPERAIRVALVAIDFEDQPFVVTLPKQSDPFGNPQVDPVPREEVPAFYASFWGTPGPLNHGHTIHEYWMEQSRGKVGIPQIDPYGPYRMPRRLFEYGLNEYNQRTGCPAGFTCDGRMERDADALWMADAGEDVRSRYDVVLRIYAGYDETTVWQEFGEMKFASRDDIPEVWGNPDRTKPRWVTTRYVPWTSWLAGAQQWGLSSVRQGESSGTITHELGHLVFRIGDNNNNPYVTPYRRVGTGPWDMMDRGSFNGPGGPHRRWVVPAAEGASMPAGLMLRNRLAMELLPIEQVLQLSRDALAQSGPAVARVVARVVDSGPGAHAGISVRLDGAEPQDRTPACDRNADSLCAGDAVFNFYSVEVVQRIGYDSFTPDSGVLVAKNKDRQNNSCGYGCHAWVIDAHPEDIDRLDFVRPNGERVMRTIADYRQLNDALFHAGLRSGSEFEWVDEPNRLHVYVIERHTDAQGILSYTVGVRSLDGAGPRQRAVRLEAPPTAASSATTPSFSVTVRNTGAASGAAGGEHSGVPAAVFASDIYRVSVAVDDAGWAAGVQNALVAVKAGESASVPVFAWRASGSPAPARVTVTVVSESDAAARAEAVTTVQTVR
jgi:M6 family metalloprotease-like protein